MRSKSWKRSWLSAIERRIERPGVVDEHVDRGVVGEHPRRRGRRSRRGRERSAEYAYAVPPAASISRLGLLELVHRCARRAAGCRRPRAILQRRRAGRCPLDAPVMTTVLPVDRALERAVLEQVGVEVALPVVPELVGVAVERRAPRCRSPRSARSVSRVSNCAREADVLERPPRACRSPPGSPRRTSFSARQLHQHRHDALGQRVDQALVDAHREVRRVRGPGERVEDLARALRLRAP